MVETAPIKVSLSCPNALIGHPELPARRRRGFPLETCLPAVSLWQAGGNDEWGFAFLRNVTH